MIWKGNQIFLIEITGVLLGSKRHLLYAAASNPHIQKLIYLS